MISTKVAGTTSLLTCHHSLRVGGYQPRAGRSVSTKWRQHLNQRNLPYRLKLMSQSLDVNDLEALALAVRRVASLDEGEILSSMQIARRALGPKPIQIVAALTTPAIIGRVHGEWRIFISPRAPDRNFNIAHELGHWILDREGVPRGPETERHADHIGAAILASPAAMRRVHAHVGEDYRAIANAFDATQSLAVLRTAHVLGADRALVSSIVRVHRAKFAWPDEPIVRRWANERPPPGVERVRLSGAYDRGRVVLRVK